MRTLPWVQANGGSPDASDRGRTIGVHDAGSHERLPAPGSGQSRGGRRGWENCRSRPA